MSSETAAARGVLAEFCVGIGIDIGFGGDAIVPTAITFDLPQMYCPSFEGHRQILRGDCRRLDFICDQAFDWVYSSHLIEDFFYADQIGIITEWRRCLAPGGVLILNCPNQRRFLAHCAATGQSINEAHKETDYSLRGFIDHVLVFTGTWETIYENDSVGAYSWHLVARKA